jgi:hypothetical protein
MKAYETNVASRWVHFFNGQIFHKLKQRATYGKHGTSIDHRVTKESKLKNQWTKRVIAEEQNGTNTFIELRQQIGYKDGEESGKTKSEVEGYGHAEWLNGCNAEKNRNTEVNHPVWYYLLNPVRACVPWRQRNEKSVSCSRNHPKQKSRK